MLKQNTWMSVSMLGGLLITSTSFAAYSPTPAPYIGAQLGWGNIHQDKVELSDVQVPGLAVTNFSSTTSNAHGGAGRIFAGYLFSPMWGVELGWSKFRNFSNNITVTYSNGATINASGRVKTDAVDLVAKGIYTFQNDFNIYGKLGAAYIMQHGSASALVPGTGFTVSVDNEVSHLYPTFAVGLGYDFACNWTADVSWTRIQKTGGSNNTSSTDLAAVGLIYKIV